MASFPSPTMIKTNGIDMAVYEDDPRNSIPVVLCRGFPEFACSSGFRVLAPDRRGYANAIMIDWLKRRFT